MPALSTLFNGILVGASGYAMYCITPEASYAFSACAFGLCHGLLGLIQNFKGDGAYNCSKAKEISTDIMEIVPLPLMNIQLYLSSQQSSTLAMGHGLFIIPLAFDMITKLFTDEGDESPTETLKDLTTLGNCVSLMFLAVNDDSYSYGFMAVAAFSSKYGAMLLDHYFEGTAENATLFSESIFFILASMAGGSSAIKGE